MISIIGAGPVGSYLGYLLSKDNINNTIIEEHTKIGRPEQCTGLISRNIEDIVPYSWVQKAVLNKVRGAVISCGKQEFEISAKEHKAYVFDRSLFDKLMAAKAEEQGSKILLGHTYISHSIGSYQSPSKGAGLNVKIRKGSINKILKSSLLVGADGPLSKVAKNSGLYGGRKFLVGTQAIIKVKNPSFDKDKVQLCLDSRYSDGFFSWIVPIDGERVKAGLASFSKSAEYLKAFLQDKFDGYKIEERHAGIIPLYRKIPLQNREKNVFLVGDAALHVKATSGGGVVNGMLGAKCAYQAIKSGDFEYEKRLKDLRKNLMLHQILRNKLNKMDDSKKTYLLDILNSKRTKELLLEFGDMDFPKRFLFRLLISEPRLLRFLV